MRPLDDGRARRTHRESTKESIVAGYTGRSLAMAGGIIGIAAVAAYFGIAHILSLIHISEPTRPY